VKYSLKRRRAAKMVKRSIAMLILGVLLLPVDCFASDSLLAMLNGKNQPNAQQIRKAIKNGADVNERTISGKTVLMWSVVINQNPEIISILVKEGADVNAKAEDGFTALIASAMHNKDLEIMKILIKAGADINARADYGLTALMVAAGYNKNPEVITVLLKAGANAKIKSKGGKTAFDYAKDNEHIKGTEVYWKLNQLQYE
jgi:ankyrin repeat protein